MNLEFKTHWRKIFAPTPLAFTLLAVALAVPRFFWFLNGQYNNVIVIFLVMWILPFILLTRNGRATIGIKRPKNLLGIFSGFLLGVLAAFIVYLIGLVLFEKTDDHWYVSVMNSFNKNDLIADAKPSILLFFLISLPTMIFSPIGEEFFFRGMIHEGFRQKYGDRIATLTDASFFGITHLAHHGLLVGAGISLMPSAPVWVFLMMLVSVVFAFMRKINDSIWGAVVCHAGFNLGMMYAIFYWLHD